MNGFKRMQGLSSVREPFMCHFMCHMHAGETQETCPNTLRVARDPDEDQDPHLLPVTNHLPLGHVLVGILNKYVFLPSNSGGNSTWSLFRSNQASSSDSAGRPTVTVGVTR